MGVQDFEIVKGARAQIQKVGQKSGSTASKPSSQPFGALFGGYTTRNKKIRGLRLPTRHQCFIDCQAVDL